MDVKTITITQAEYEAMQERLMFLDCLEACGVDNWGGYDDSHELLQQMKDGEFD